jgi:hypothetical protein
VVRAGVVGFTPALKGGILALKKDSDGRGRFSKRVQRLVDE